MRLQLALRVLGQQHLQWLTLRGAMEDLQTSISIASKHGTPSTMHGSENREQRRGRQAIGVTQSMTSSSSEHHED